MAIPPPPPGWNRYLVKSKFGAGRDFAVLDPSTEEQRYFIDGKMGTRPKAEIQDAAGTTIYRVRGTLLGIPKHITISNADGDEAADMRAKFFSPIKSQIRLTVPGGEDWLLEGTFIEKNYSMTAGGRPVAQITQKWVTKQDTYTLDVAEGVDTGLALSVLWAVDRWVERD